MPDDIKNAKLTRFINDKEMSSCVYEVLQNHFMREMNDFDVHILAASTLSVYRLKQAWRELENFLIKTDRKDKVINNVGL